METMGQRFKKAREASNLTIEKVNKLTNIHVKVLIALENDTADKFLTQIYLKNFIKSYARFLGLDYEAFLGEYITEHPDINADLLGTADQKSGISTQDIKRYAAICISVIAILIFLAATVKLFGTKPANKKAEVKKAALLPVKKSAVLAIKSQTPSAEKPAELKPFKLVIKVKEDSWMQIKVDGVVVFYGILPKGNMKVFEPKKTVELWTGNARAIELVLDDKPIGSPGDGVQKDIVITKYGIKK